MKKTLLFVALAAVVMVPLLTTCFVSAFEIAAGPAEVRLIGTLYSPDHKDIKGLAVFRVHIRHKAMVLKAEDARDLLGDASSLEIFQAIFPPQLLIEGSKDAIALLQKPETEGKLLTMQGNLYVSNGMFYVEEVWIGKK